MSSRRPVVFALALIASLISVSPSLMLASTTIVVKPSNMDGWAFQTGHVLGGAVTSSAGFEIGPATPPLQNGSAEFKTGTDGDSFAQLRNNSYQGVPLSSLTELSYDTYVTANHGTVAPYISLLVDLNNNGVFDEGIDDRLFFEPAYQTATYQTILPDGTIQTPGVGVPIQNAQLITAPDGSTLTTLRVGQWQHWDALIGGWWSNNDGFGGPPLTTFANYIARFDNTGVVPAIVNISECLGGVRISAGAGSPVWNDFKGNADNFKIGVNGNSTTYDFEFENLPIPECGVVPPQGTVTACKFYDFNANGALDPGELLLSNWPITISPLGNAIPNEATRLTSGGCVSWTNVAVSLNPHTFTEGTPNESNWVHSTPGAVVVNVEDNETLTINFGNYCRAASGGRTIGFWGNKNGLALTTAADFAALTSLKLVNKNGSDRDFTGNLSQNRSALDSWLKSADATNMAYMLSAQLAAMKLNALHGFVDGNAFSLCFNGTVNNLINAANTALLADQNTSAGDPNRNTQQTLKNCLDTLNNGGPVVPPIPCAYTFGSSAAQSNAAGGVTQVKSTTAKTFAP